jgi:hypothetical protein
VVSESWEERSRRFNETTGVCGYVGWIGDRLVTLGGNHHPDRCRCQGDPFPGDGRGNSMMLRRGTHSKDPYADTTPHKHYDRTPFSCARCSCDHYVPHDEAKKDDLRRQARAIVAEAMGS